ncbi:hypothetical protein G5V58_08390 [Nocardioides anomalus]|uniref:Uncharacterized protein n=1 Tax=Nocardioides anomalus TaxID=2712223 RepID=A0A6G6WC24_9ACTN|nr:hypothetical protein [Nocardioides anomalus]QIG42792.1 hypothetical protein G5V58_08390 [Nocardioides anomalus]
MTRTRLPLLASAATALLLTLGAPAYASHGDDDGGGDDHGGGGGGGGIRVVETGSCSDGARWKLKVKSDDGGLEVEGEVDSKTAGQGWRWKLKDNGVVVAQGTATTGGRSGSFSVERQVADRAGTDRITFKASYRGQTCAGVASY